MILIPRDERTDLAVRLVLSGYRRKALANVEGACAGEDVECLHDLRVAVRKTRSGLSEMRRAFAAGELEPLRDELSWLGGATGSARDADVLLETLPVYSRDLPEAQREAIMPLLTGLTRHRESGQHELAEVLRSERATRLFADWGTFLDTRQSTGEHADRPIAETAARRIRKRWKRLRKDGRAIEEGTPVEALHELRIVGKKLRYLLEMFRPVFGKDALAPLIKPLRGLQEVLGDLNDCAVQGAAIADLANVLTASGDLPAATQEATAELLIRIDRRTLARRKDFAERFEALDSEPIRADFRELFQS